jgi:hypothetical protein
MLSKYLSVALPVPVLATTIFLGLAGTFGIYLQGVAVFVLFVWIVAYLKEHR